MNSVPTQSSEDIPPEDREIYQRLAKLQDIYAQVFELRTLLPEKLVNATQIAIDNPNTTAPRKIAVDLKNAAIAGSKNIKGFKSDYQSEDMKVLWQKANSSEFPQGEDVWTRNYAELAGERKAEQGDPVKKQPDEDAGVEPAKSDDVDVVKKFQELNPTFAAKSLEEDRVLPLELNIDGVGFIVERAETETGKNFRLRLSNRDTADQQSKDILTHIEREHSSEALEAILSLMSSYKEVKTAPCQKCGNVFDANLQFPLTRKRKEESSKDIAPVWICLHQSCSS